MKSFIMALSISLVAGVASAELDINFGNDATAVAGVGSGGTVDVGEVLGQLIWTASVPTAQAGDNAALGTGEFLLASVLSPSGFWGTFDEGLSTYVDLDVGGADINAGYFLVRLFDDSAKAEDDWYLQFDLAGPVLTEYDIVPRPTPYLTANLMPGGSTIDLDDATYGYQAIPEPTVAALLGIFGSSMLVGRRLFSKKS